jgi:hypothetical protein
MRSYKLSSAILAAAALLALATAGAASARTPHHKRNSGIQGANCRTTLNVAPRLITTGETALAFGRSLCPAQTVTLYQRAVGGPGYAVAGTTTTDAKGFWQITLAPQTNNSQIYAAVGASTSRRVLERVAAQVSLVGPPESKQVLAGLKTGRANAVTFSGTVSPNDAGALLVLQRENAIKGNEWHQIGHTLVNSSGGFALTHVFVAPGASNIRILLRGNHRNAASASNILSYQISQAQNPALTIISSLDPLAYNGSTVISGTVAGAPNTAVTLMGRSAGHKFGPIATVNTDGSGNYAFPAQTPLTSMYYKVNGSSRSSAVLYQGVKYLLTATPGATTITSGQALTFTGTVTPAREHEIYIERENLTGTGFHVVAIGKVAANGTYAVSKILYAPGTEVLRVKIPGDPENGGTASAPVTVTVNPLAASKLTPEPPGNTTAPPEGQV